MQNIDIKEFNIEFITENFTPEDVEDIESMKITRLHTKGSKLGGQRSDNNAKTNNGCYCSNFNPKCDWCKERDKDD